MGKQQKPGENKVSSYLTNRKLLISFHVTFNGYVRQDHVNDEITLLPNIQVCEIHIHIKVHFLLSILLHYFKDKQFFVVGWVCDCSTVLYWSYDGGVDQLL